MTAEPITSPTMSPAQSNSNPAPQAGRPTRGLPNIRRYFERRPVILVMLFLLAIVLLAAVGALSRIYHAQQDALGNRWFDRGQLDLKAARYAPAVTEFRTALLYSRDNYPYQLSLAEALLGLKRTDEAYAYLINLWERQPENGVVNLELARIAAERRDIEKALRYYHNAIYATWPGDQETQRRDTRLELIGFLLRINARTQAQSELIALDANLGDDPARQAQVGDLFIQAHDYQDALAAYRQSLKEDRHNSAAASGAGLAAFELARYAEAQHYLQVAVADNPGDVHSADRLKMTDWYCGSTPFVRKASPPRRANRIVVEAFRRRWRRRRPVRAVAVGSEWVPRLFASAAASSPRTSSDQWAKRKPEITQSGVSAKSRPGE